MKGKWVVVKVILIVFVLGRLRRWRNGSWFYCHRGDGEMRTKTRGCFRCHRGDGGRGKSS